MHKTFLLKSIILTLSLLLLSACSNNQLVKEDYDPLEPLNRKIYAFNDFFDRTIARPIAQAYNDYIPDPIQTGVFNFYSNVDDASVALNDLLQLKGQQALQDTTRLLINSSIGILGLIDFATDMGFPKHDEDLNQTLGYWGAPDGPYLMMPFLGPYNVRSLVSASLDTTYINPLYYIETVSVRDNLLILDFFNTRVHLLLASEMLDMAALDPYIYVRESFRQSQKSKINDGREIEPEEDDLDLLDEM